MVFFHVFSIKFDPKQLAEIEPAETVTKRAADLYILWAFWRNPSEVMASSAWDECHEGRWIKLRSAWNGLLQYGGIVKVSYRRIVHKNQFHYSIVRRGEHSEHNWNILLNKNRMRNKPATPVRVWWPSPTIRIILPTPDAANGERRCGNGESFATDKCALQDQRSRDRFTVLTPRKLQFVPSLAPIAVALAMS